MPQTDFLVSDAGSIVLIAPITEEAKAFVEENVPLEPWQWLGHAFSVDRRYAQDLIDGIEADGLTVGVE